MLKVSLSLSWCSLRTVITAGFIYYECIYIVPPKSKFKNVYKLGNLSAVTAPGFMFIVVYINLLNHNSRIYTQLSFFQRGYYGWIGDSVVIEMALTRDCDLLMIKERFLPLKYAFGFTNNSPHAQIFSKQ